MNYHFSNVLGDFILDGNLNIIAEGKEDKIFSDAEEVPEDKLLQVLTLFTDKKYFPKFRKRNLELTKKCLKESVQEDQLIIQSVSNIGELDWMCNVLSKRLREWFSWWYPELSERISDNKTFVDEVCSIEKSESTMGAELDKFHVEEMKLLARKITGLYELRTKHEEYLERVMKKYCPNLLALAGITIGGSLVELSKGLKRLALLPSSTVQLLGAEKALFRHIKTGTRSPKHGVIFNHQFIQKAKNKDRGKMARMLADKLSMCARLDYFKGEFKADEYRELLEKKLNEQKN